MMLTLWIQQEPTYGCCCGVAPRCAGCEATNWQLGNPMLRRRSLLSSRAGLLPGGQLLVVAVRDLHELVVSAFLNNLALIDDTDDI